MSVDEKITLEDNSEYLLMTETVLDGVKYFFASEIQDENPTDNFKIFKEIEDEEGFLVEEVEDEELKEQLLEQFEDILDKEIDEED